MRKCPSMSESLCFLMSGDNLSREVIREICDGKKMNNKMNEKMLQT